MKYGIVGIIMLLDIVTGLLYAFMSKSFTSQGMREGLFHKCGSILTVVFGAVVSYAQVYYDIGTNVPVASTICAYIVLMEIGSIIENLGKINPKLIPLKLRNFFGKLNQ